jgi:sarcosine oxidase delta subunit
MTVHEGSICFCGHRKDAHFTRRGKAKPKRGCDGNAGDRLKCLCRGVLVARAPRGAVEDDTPRDRS